MQIFKKFKNLFSNKEELEDYKTGLEKTSKEFKSKLSILNGKYKKVSDEYFDELEEIFITADIGVETVMDLIDKLKRRVKKRKYS